MDNVFLEKENKQSAEDRLLINIYFLEGNSRGVGFLSFSFINVTVD